MIGVTLTLVTLALVSAYLYSRKCHRFWSSRGIPTPPYIPFIGHTHKQGSPDLCHWIDTEVYNKYCRSGFCGMYEGHKPYVMVGDIEIIKRVMVKDFDHFTDRRWIELPHENDKTMNDMVSSANGQEWKDLRSILTPAFTSGKLRGMFDLVGEKVDILVRESLRESLEKPSVDIKDYASRFILDAIASCAFGFESNSICDKDAIFPKRAAIFSDISGLGMSMKIILLLLNPKLFQILNISLFPSEVLFFNDIVKRAIDQRRKGEKRGDFLDLLLEAQVNTNSSKWPSNMVLDDKKIVAQSILFITAGYDTTASTIAFASYLLAKNPEEQNRLRQELRGIVDENNKITYQGIMEAKFLEACIMETLRFYPPLTLTERLCTKPYKIPGTDVILSPKHFIQIPIWSIHRDDQYWPEPEIFRPDRFMPGNKENITNYTFLPFGVGPRNCLGMRFALMEAKLVIAKLVMAANLEIAPGYEELKLSTPGGFLKAEGGVNLHLVPFKEE